MSKKYKPTSTLEYYNFRETNQMAPVIGSSYKVKVSDKDGNIITIEKDDALYACVSLAFDKDTGVLSLLDVAHENSILAEIEMPNADYIYNCRYDEELNSILFDVKSLYGNNTNTIEIDVEDLVELYEAGQGIEIGEKSEETGRKPISIKLADGENLLKLSESGLSISDEVVTDEEVIAAISGKADIDYVDDKISRLTEEIDNIYGILGTDVDEPNLDERIDSKADLDEFNDLEEEVGELETNFNELSGKADSLDERVEDIESELSGLTPLSDKIYEISGNVDSLSAKVENNEVEVFKITEGLPDNVREAYIVKNKLGEQLGERINIYVDSTIVSINYLPELQIIRYIYIDSNGIEQTVDIDLKKVVIESEFADGLQVNNGIVSIKIDPASDGYLTVSENGIKLSGIFTFFQDLLSTNAQQWSAINGESTRAQNVESQLWNAINAESSSRESTDNQIWAAVNDLQADFSTEKTARERADAQFANDLAAEMEARIAGDSAVSGMIHTAIDRETQRATGVEAILSGAIDTERAQRIAGDEEFFGKVEAEKERAEEAETDLRNAIAQEINERKTAISGFTGSLEAEQQGREAADNDLSERIAAIENAPYTTKTYVDGKDAETLNTAISSAVTNANSYTDGKIDTLDANIREYIDIENTNLQKAISKNTTKINAISNLRGVTEQGDTTNYDDSGNGILDVLHKEFHNLINGLTEQQIVGLLADMLRRIEALENA